MHKSIMMLARRGVSGALPKSLAKQSRGFRGTPHMSPKVVSAAEAMNAAIHSNMRVFVHGAAAAPTHLLQAMVDERSGKVENVEFVGLHCGGSAPHINAKHAKSFRVNAMFLGSNERKLSDVGLADYVPVFLSEIPLLFRRGILPIDVALLNVSPPDKHGFCSLGVSAEASIAATETAKVVVAQINKHMPRTHGDGNIHISNFDFVVEHDDPLPIHPKLDLTDAEKAIGRNVAQLIPDRACLQMGVGAIPDAVLAQLGNHKDLGVHTEMFSDGLVELYEKGAITNRYKKIHSGEVVCTFSMGTKRVYDFCDDNPFVQFRDVTFTNDTHIIRQLTNMIAINSAIEIDLTGQVCADSIGTRQFSGVGGQMDFIRGSALSEGGKPIIAVNSVTTKGESKIVPTLKPGAGVATTRAHVHYIATEWGVAYLYGKNLRQRAKALVEIAHPDHRAALHAEAVKRFGQL